MGNDTDKTTANKQMKNDTGNSLKHEEYEGVSSENDMLTKPYLIILLSGWNYFIWWYALVLYSKYYNDIFKGDNEDDNDMAVAHLSAICEEFEDLGNKSRGSYYDDKMAFVQAEGTPDNKVCILTLTVAKLKC